MKLIDILDYTAKTCLRVAIIGAIATISYDIGKNKGYSEGFEDTKTEIRQHICNTKQEIYRLEQQASNTWCKSHDTTKVFTYGTAYKFEADAYGESYLQLDKLIDYDVDRLTPKDLKETVEFNKKYNK